MCSMHFKPPKCLAYSERAMSSLGCMCAFTWVGSKGTRLKQISNASFDKRKTLEAKEHTLLQCDARA